MTWPKWVVIGLVLFGTYGFDFFYFILPSDFLWLTLAGFVFWIPLFVFSVGALFRLRWKLISTFAIVWVLLLSPLVFDVWALRYWLRGQGFRVSTLLTREYPSRCRLTEFVENGVKQTAGFCRGFDRGDFFDYIVYDTTGEFIMPVSQRSPEWKREMAKATEEPVVLRENAAFHLFGNYYAVYVSLLDGKG
jgi:hypothetical protein